MFNHHIIKKITFMEEGEYFHDNLLKGMIAACFLYCDALEVHVSARFGRRTLSDCEGKVGSTSEIDLKCATDSEHNEVHKYNFYNFIKNIFGVICLLIMLFIKKKKNYEKEKSRIEHRSSNARNHIEFLRITSINAIHKAQNCKYYLVYYISFLLLYVNEKDMINPFAYNIVKDLW